jgi:hypothetical protein
MQVIWDPTGIYPRGALFAHYDFGVTLHGGGWPTDMIVRDLRNNQCYRIQPYEKIEVKDRDWFQYIREKYDEQQTLTIEQGMVRN